MYEAYYFIICQHVGWNSNANQRTHINIIKYFYDGNGIKVIKDWNNYELGFFFLVKMHSMFYTC